MRGKREATGLDHGGGRAPSEVAEKAQGESREAAGVEQGGGRAPTIGPVTNARWAWSVRRLVRVLMWALPGYAFTFGLVTMGRWDGTGRLPYLENGNVLHLLGWVVSVWLGLMALVALAGMLAAAHSRRAAAGGLMVGLTGVVLWLPFAALPGDTPVYGLDARALSLVGATFYSAGWLLAGRAVHLCGLFRKSDGLMLMVAAPMVGIGGQLVGPLQSVGAVFTLAAGIGIAWTAGRLVPSLPVIRTTPMTAAVAGAQAVAGKVATTGSAT